VKIKALLIAIGLLASVVTAVGLAAAQVIIRPQYVIGQQLIGVYGLSNGDAVIVSSQSTKVYFVYQHADGRESDLQRVDWPLATAPDRVQADVCGNVVHVAGPWDSWGGTLYSIAWTIPIEYHVSFPIVCRGAGSWPNN
jgi:hypothetical protein